MEQTKDMRPTTTSTPPVRKARAARAAPLVRKAREARLEARVTDAQKAVLQKAAVLSGRNLSEFVVAAAHEAAVRLLREHETIRLSREGQIAFVSALLAPGKPNARLKKAAAAYRTQLGL